jgi:glycosyl transferase family 25
MPSDQPRTSIKVISLDTSVDRRRAFTQMTGGLNLDWGFSPAHSAITEPLQYNDRAAVRRSGRPLSPAEIGCYASHFKLWEWLSNSNFDQAIILEDDVIVDWALIEKMVNTRLSDYGIDLLRLHTYSPFRWTMTKYKFFSLSDHLVRLIGMVPGAAAYVLSRAAARNLVSNYSTISAPVDWILPRYWEHRITNYCIFPFPVIHRHTPSTIGERYAARRAVSDSVARIGWRVRDRAERAYAEHFVIKRLPLGPTRDSGPPFISAEPTAADAGRAAQQSGAEPYREIDTNFSQPA